MKGSVIILFITILMGCKKSEDETVEIIPLAPTELKATEISKDQVDLTWKDNSTNEIGYKIERSTDSGNFAEIGSTSVDITAFSDKTVNIGKNYVYRVYSYNQAGKSISYSNETSIKIINIPPSLTTSKIVLVSSGAQSGGDITSDGGSPITARGVVWDTKSNPTIELSTKTNDFGTGLGAFISNITGLTAKTLYYVRSYATNSAGTGYGNELTFNAILVPKLTTTSINGITPSGAKSGGKVISDGGSAITTTGVVWSTSSNPTIELSTKTTDAIGIMSQRGFLPNSFQSAITGLTSSKYYVRAYATNGIGTSYGNELSFTTVFGTVTSATGRIWMDRNLGATRVATSITDADSFGDLYQWGRGADGHQLRNSGTTNNLSDSDQPDHSLFIVTSGKNYDWQFFLKNHLWQGVEGVDNPCPKGFRLPTDAEWKEEVKKWSSSDANGAFSSPLKLPAAGIRRRTTGEVYIYPNNVGFYWSSSRRIDYPTAFYLDFSDTRAYFVSYGAERSFGFSCRCIKD